MVLEFEWDEGNLNHIAEHRITASEVEFVLLNRTLPVEYQDWIEGEERFAEAGATQRGRILQVISTIRGNKIRVVTAWDADREVV